MAARPLVAFISLLLVLCFLPGIDATHFAYATMRWNMTSQTTNAAATGTTIAFTQTFDYKMEAAFRWSFFSNPPIGQYANTGANVNFVPMDNPQPAAASVGGYKSLVVNLLVVQTNPPDDWFYGYVIGAPLLQQTATYRATNPTPPNYRIYYTNCCRISTLKDQNNDRDWTITGILNTKTLRSPITTGTPRVWLALNVPSIYFIPYVSQANLPVTFFLSNPTDSTLLNVQPSAFGPFTFDKVIGKVTWTPNQVGLYAIQFMIEEICAAAFPTQTQCRLADNVTPTDNGGSAGTVATRNNCCARIPLDFIFQIVVLCTSQITTNCFNPPYFYSPFDPRISPDPTKWVINFYRNVQGTFLLCATHNDSTQLVEISLPPLPPGAVMNGVKLNSANRGRPACYEYLWTPTINDVDQNLCFYATAFPSQAKSIGQYCLLLKIIDAPGFVITGIIRDFHIYHANFNRTAADWYSDPRFAPNTLARPNWVKIKLGSDYKPEWNSAATPVPTTVGNSGFGLPGNTNEGWYDWWHTDDPTLTTPGRPRNLQQIQSTTLTSGTNPNPFIFSYISSAFYPIDNRLFGNEGQAHNCHYTYEVNTYLSYVSAAASSNGQGLIFTFNMDDDFWLFVDSVLPKNWNLYGIRPLIAGKSSGVDYTLNMDDFVTNWAPVAIPGDPHTIVSGETVRLDFFYANRRGDGSPVFNISLTNFTLCDGLSSGVEIFNWPQFSDNQAVGQPKPSTSLVFYPSLGGGAGAAFATNCNGTNTCLQLSRSDRTNSISSVWYTNGKANGAGQVNPTPLLLTHGFRLEGSFQVNGAAVGAGAEGFAIVMVASDASPASGAGAGFNLGYGGALSKSLAVEFDFIQSSAANDPVGFNASYWAQISVHTRTTKNANGDYDLNSADENIGAVPRSFGGSSDTTLPLNFKNGTAHYFKIEYQPAKFDPTNPNLRGVIRVWIGRFVAPAVEAFIDQNAFNAMIGGAAYLGFTTGSGDGAANLMITWAKLLVVPTSPAQTTAIAPPFTIVAGDTGYVTIQAKDACGDLILTGGELSSFLAQYQPVLCTTPFVNATGVDNNNGSYTFYYNPVIKGLYTFPITFNGQPILNSPFPFTVVAAPVDPPSTFAIFSQPPNKYSNLAGDSGIACSRYNSLGGFLGFSQFDVSAAGDVFGTGKAGGMQTWLGLVAATDYVACALSGDTLAIAQRNIVAPTITAKWPAATKFGTLPVANSWALVAQGSRVSEVTNTNRVSMAQLSGIDASSISFTRAFNVTAESATSFCGPYARVKCVFNDTRVPAATPNQLGIEGHDRFGNLNDENVYTAFFSPDITDPSAGGYHTYNVGDSAGGFHVFDYGNPRAGEYFYYVKVNGVNIRGSQYKVVFTPGLANITTSSVSADAGVETAGTNASFITSLFDANKNPIQFQNPLDVVTAVVKLDGNVLYTVTLTWTDGSVGGVPCQKCILVGSYFPTLATTRAVLEFTINGATAVYSPVTINPGPLSAPDSNCTFEASPSALPPAGLPTSLIIQAKDRFRNLRVTPNQPGDVFYISYNPAVLASSTIGAVNLYLGIGQYQALFTPTKKGPQQTTVVVNATGAGDVPAGTPQVCQTQINILPGAPDKSTTANVFTSMTAGVEQAFTMQSFDPFGNLRDNTVAGVQVAFPDDYLYRFYSPYDDRRPEGTYTKDANTAAGTFTVRLNTTVAATYLLEVRTNPATKFSIAYPSTALINSPWTIVVKPGPTYPPNTVFTSATGSYGGFPGNQSWFQITANDIYMNQQIDFSDRTKFTVQVFNIDNGAQFGANLTLINLAVNGTYNVTYTIPPNPTSTPKLFWIKVCHPGAPAYAAWCKNLTGIALQDTGLSYATIAVAPGRAGYLSNFTIDNHDNANTPVLTTTSFSVVLSRISDGVQITPITVTCRMPLLADGTCPATSSGRVYFDATFTPTQNIGDFKVRVFAYGIVETEQSKSPGVTVTIGPGDVSPPNSKVLGLPVTIQAGTSAKFQALLADAWNHNITGSSPKTVTANLTSPDQMLIQLTTAQTNPAGAAGVLYEFDTTTQLTKAGVWTVQVYETVSFASTTRVLAVSTFRITVTPGPADRLTSYVVLPALSSDGSLTTAGQSVTLSVYPLDSYGNSVTDPSTSFTYNDPLNPNATTFTSTPSIDGNGVVSFKVQYTPYKIANPLNNTINVNLGGNPVTGTGAGVGTASPIKVLVNPASVSATYSKVRCYQTTAIAGNSVSCAVDPRDIYDNLWYVNRPDAIQASIKGRASSAVGATVVSQGNGSYVFTVDGATGATTTASQWTGSNYAADYTWSLNAEAVSLAVPALSVENGVAAGAQSVHQDLTPIRVGALRAYSVITYDQFGNRCYLRSGSDSFVFKFLIGTIDCGEQEVPPVDATGNFSIAPTTYWKDGQYNYTLSGRVVGKYTLNFTTNGTPLDCIQKFVQIVTPGFPCPPNSTYIIDKISVQAGTPIRLDVQVNDCARNAIGTGGTPIAIGNSVSGTPLLWTQIDYLSTLVAGFTAPDITRPLTLPVVQLQSRHNLLATYKTPPQPTATLRDYGTSAYTFTITPFKAGDFAVVVSFQNETNQWVAVPATPANWPSMNTDLHVLAGPPRQFAEYQPPIFTPPITAAVPTSFKLQALDQYGNVNTTNFHTYKVQLVALSNGQGYTVPITISPGTNGSNTFNLMSAWHGSFSLKITMTPNDGSPDVVGDTVLLNVSHATCAYDNPSKPYRCPDGSCVAAYSQCPGIASGDASCTGVYCKLTGGSLGCAANVQSCACDPGTTMCPDGHCAASCPPFQDACPVGYVQCKVNGVATGACRKTEGDCPSVGTCPPGYVVCANGLSCSQSLAACPVMPTCSSGAQCPSGLCVTTMADCPTQPSCGAGKVLCLTDFSCQTDRSKCPQQYECYSPTAYRCPGGSCRNSSAQCPSLTTCPLNWVKCEGTRCAETLSGCPDITNQTCALNQTRCPLDGACTNNLLFCASKQTCPPSRKVQCYDGSCASSVLNCPQATTQSASCGTYLGITLVNCPDGSCAKTLAQCPTGATCPDASPVMCGDGSCVVDSIKCPILPDCPPDAPVRCSDGLSCRGSLPDCPTIPSCTAGSIKCSDGTCALAQDTCVPAAECKNGTVRCSGGECVVAYALCPTHVTCSIGFSKCSDGTCQESCPYRPSVCQANEVVCPQAAAGVQCEKSLDACPPSFVCPSGLRIRCSDSSCAVTVANCPSNLQPPPADKFPCADGTWASSLDSCPTPITCPSTSPFKCFDNTCRKNTDDCPPPVSCTGGKFRCSNGACVDPPWDTACIVSSAKCADATPYQCLNSTCVKYATDCDASDPLESGTGSVCPKGFIQCQAGNCVKPASADTDCAVATCPTSLPVICSSGLCVKDGGLCPQANGCPASAPLSCTFTGACMTQAQISNGDCKSTVPPCPRNTSLSTQTVKCDLDGSCAASQAECPLNNGCPGNTPIRCLDKSCAKSGAIGDAGTCTDPVSNHNRCPTATPYACEDGFCATSFTTCPYQTATTTCGSSTPFRCADGVCVSSSVQCSLVVPCNFTLVSTADGMKPKEQRCGDGTCRAYGTCPLVNLCAPGVRCDSGLCAADTLSCNLNYTSGCLATQFKCASGECAADAPSCSQLPSPSGCPAATPNKCFDGSCKAVATDCNYANGCPAGLEIRCNNDGSCQDTVQKCNGRPACTKTICPDGSCNDKSNCTSFNGCPVSTPVRCADGSCAQNEAGVANGCPLTVICNSGQFLCADGKCRATSALCPAVAPCPAGQTRCGFDCSANCTSGGATQCPPGTPILCKNGGCVGNAAQCASATGGPKNQLCVTTDKTVIQCQDGSCGTATACIKGSNDARSNGNTPQETAEASSGCPANYAMCPNGLCVPQFQTYRCGIIPRCPKGQNRCDNGTCAVTCGAKLRACSAGNRCEDGWCRNLCLSKYGDGSCRSVCLPYDGCGLAYPFHCGNRECAKDAGGCQAAAQRPQMFYRRLLQKTNVVVSSLTPCIADDCLSSLKAQQSEVTVDITANTNVDIVFNSGLTPVLTLGIPSGTFVLKSNGTTTTTLSIRAVAESDMRYAINEVHASRRFSYGSFLPFSSTVLSAAFSCVTSADVDHFNVPITVTAWIDLAIFGASLSKKPTADQYGDVCLAYLYELPGFKAWRCVVDNATARSEGGLSYAHPEELTSYQYVRAALESCKPETIGGIQQLGDGVPYAFILAPRTQNPEEPEGLDVVQRNIVWIILGVLLGIAALVLLAYCAFRLFRYRGKYHKERDEADRLQEEVDNMKQFGGEAGNKDDAVAMTSNPLSVQLKDVQKQYDAEELKLKQAENELRQQEGEIRQEHIAGMRDNRDKLAEELERLKKQLQEQQASGGPKATFHDDDTSADAPGGDVVREDISAPTSKPKRKNI